MKPRGLWVSVEGNGDGWSDWCRDEQFGGEGLAFEHEVVLAEDAHLLWLSTAEHLDAFTVEYGTPMYPAEPTIRHRGIDWPGVAKVYQGIVIAPYLWERRLDPDTFWYYGWDCASGCIWDLTAIARLELFDRGQG